jgi:hypothetical protein
VAVGGGDGGLSVHRGKLAIWAVMETLNSLGGNRICKLPQFPFRRQAGGENASKGAD